MRLYQLTVRSKDINFRFRDILLKNYNINLIIKKNPELKKMLTEIRNTESLLKFPLTKLMSAP